MHDSRPDAATRASALGDLESMQAWGLECEFPFSPSIHAKENVPQTRNLL